MKLRVLLLCVCLGLAVHASARADSLDESFDRASRALAAGDPVAARRELQALVALGIDDPDVYRNLGIAEAESMRYGHAMVAFERALGLAPRDEVSARGLANAESMLARRRAEARGVAETVDRRGALTRYGRSIAEPVASYGTLVGAWLFGLACVALAFVRRESLRIAAGITATIGALVGVAFGLAIIGRARLEGVVPAIVVGPVDARVAPDSRASTVGHFEEGERVDVVEWRGRFVRIAVDGRSRGFVPRGAVGTY